MDAANPFSTFAFGDLFETVLPDFVLAFAFFAALSYAVIHRRLEHPRASGIVAAAVGMAMASGLVWWEYINGFSIRNLGPIAVGFAVLLMGGLIFQSVRMVGGSWAGVGIGLGTSLLIGSFLGLDWPVQREIIHSLIILAVVLGVLAFLLYRHAHLPHLRPSGAALSERALVRHDWSDLRQDRAVGRQLERGLHDLSQRADHLADHPEQAQDVMLQLRRMLPAEGWLTERMARLRERARYAKDGRIAHVKEISQCLGRLSSRARLRATFELAEGYKQIKLDHRLERLDRAVAANELRIRQLTEQAQKDLIVHNHLALAKALEAASKLQRHNARLFRIIDRTEARLSKIAAQVAQQAGGEDA